MCIPYHKSSALKHLLVLLCPADPARLEGFGISIHIFTHIFTWFSSLFVCYRSLALPSRAYARPLYFVQFRPEASSRILAGIYMVFSASVELEWWNVMWSSFIHSTLWLLHPLNALFSSGNSNQDWIYGPPIRSAFAVSCTLREIYWPSPGTFIMNMLQNRSTGTRCFCLEHGQPELSTVPASQFHETRFLELRGSEVDLSFFSVLRTFEVSRSEVHPRTLWLIFHSDECLWPIPSMSTNFETTFSPMSKETSWPQFKKVVREIQKKIDVTLLLIRTRISRNILKRTSVKIVESPLLYCWSPKGCPDLR